MAGYVIHLAIGEEYIRKYRDDIKDKQEFLKGIVAPDRTCDNRKAHYGEKDLVESLRNFLTINKEELDTDYIKGYFLHLFTDYIFYGKYFKRGHYYQDYDKTNKKIIEKYDLKVPEDLKKYAKFVDGEPEHLKYHFIYEIIELSIKNNIKENMEKVLKGESILMNTKINFAGIEMKNPVTVASGTFGYGREYSEFYDLGKIGAIITKGTSLKPRPGNKPSRVCETPSGMLNSIGLQNPGVEYFAKYDLPFLRKFDTKIIVNACGSSIEEYVELCKILNTLDIDGVELNLSCPNVKAGCLAFGTTYEGVKEVTSAVRKVLDKPLIVKLTPNVTDITQTAKGAEDGGADAISLINTLLGMKIDINTRKPVLANNTGGLSGPAVKPVAVRMVYQAAKAVNIPVMGLGGIVNGEDAIEFMLAGASTISIGCGNFIDPYCAVKTVEQIEEYMKKHNIEDINDIVGKVEMN